MGEKNSIGGKNTQTLALELRSKKNLPKKIDNNNSNNIKKRSA